MARKKKGMAEVVEASTLESVEPVEPVDVADEPTNEFVVVKEENAFVATEVPIVPANYDEIANLVDDYVVKLGLDDVETFESGIVGARLFGSKYIYYHRPMNIFLTFASDRFRIFRVSDILHVLRDLFPTENTNGVITPYLVKFYNEKLTYLNSYSRFAKESLRYNPLLLNIFTLKHTKNNISKRAIVDVVKQLDRIVSEGYIDFNQPVDDKDFEVLVQTLGPRSIYKTFNIGVSERDITPEVLKESRLIENFRELIDFVNKVHNNFPNSLKVERGITLISKKLILKYLDEKILEGIF